MATSIILFATPFFFLLIFIELYINKKRNVGVYRLNDSLTSLSLGVISQTKKLVIFSFAAIVYSWAPDSLALFHLSEDSILTWIFSFIFYDFLYYWFHRTSHNVNFLWASHVVHHQSEDYNLTTALRQTSSSVMIWIFYIPSFVIGIPAEVFFVSGALNLIYQYWVHTQLIGKLGWYELIFVTPSHHRVHHGQNEIYIDRNHGGVFILWDKWFGTFQEELDTEEVIYGVRRPLKSFNPLWANVHTWFTLLTDAIRTKSWLDKLRIWFMPTGWRPGDVEIQYPILKQPAGEQVKYNKEPNSLTKIYILMQYLFSIIFGVIFIQGSVTLPYTTQLVIWIVITAPLLIN
ncbi:MAG: alkylglycerol monooxygenase, partial [Polaribacter sp.]